MSQSTLPTNCPDCTGSIREVMLFGRGAENPLSGAAHDTAVVYYTQPHAPRSTWLVMFEPEGTVRSMKCDDCGRIFLYGTPDLNREPIPETIECLQCGTALEADQSTCPKCGWTYEDAAAEE